MKSARGFSCTSLAIVLPFMLGLPSQKAHHMAPRTREMPRITTLNADGTIDAEEPQATIEDDIQKQLDDIEAEFQQSDTDVSWQVIVNRAAGPNFKGGKEPWLFNCDVSEIGGIRERLRDEYGEGVYRIRVRRNNRNFRQFDYPIETAVRKKDEDSQNLSRALLERMDRLEARNTQLLERMVQGNNAPPDPFAMVERITTVVKNLMPPAAPAIATPATDSFALMNTVFGMAEKLVDLRGDATPAKEGSNWIDVLRDAFQNPEAIKTVMEGLQPKQREPQRRMLPPQFRGQLNGQQRFAVHEGAPVADTNRRPQESNTNVERTGETRAPEAQTNGPGEFFTLETAIRYLNTRAAKNSDIVFYADWIFENLPDAAIRFLLDTPNVLDLLAQQFPGTVAHRAWYAALLEEIKKPVETGDEQEPGATHEFLAPGAIHQPPGRAGNVFDPQADGALGEVGETEPTG